jgi:hypothetical protein
MSEEIMDELVFSKNVIEFVTVGKEYCSIVENHAGSDTFSFITTMQKMLPLLYLKASLLPVVDEENVEIPEKFVSEVDYNYLLNRLTEKLGKYDNYQEVFEPGMQFSENPIEASIAENICDIYQDIKDFILNYRIGSSQSMADALWECRNNFEQYWGQKLVNGLRAIHQLIYSGNEWEDESPKNKVLKSRSKDKVLRSDYFNKNSGEEHEDGF